MKRVHPTAIINEPCIMGKRIEIMEGVIVGAQPVTYKRISRIPIRRKRIQALYGVEIGDDAVFHAGSLIMAGLEGPTKIDSRVVFAQKVNFGHDSKVGAGSTLMVGCDILGFVTIGKGTVIGSGSVIRPRVKIGDNSLVGMGSVVTKEVPSNSIAYNTTKSGEPVYCHSVRKTRSYMKELIRRALV